jgi:protein-S-isoprenylcysteine O-methyltransferase Ste14
MRSTEFEFRYRFWFICLVYFVGFGLYRFDHLNVTEALVAWLFRRSDPHLDSLAARHVMQGSFVLSAALVTAAAWIRTWAGAYLRTDVVHDGELHTEKLVADGPYRHVRNPLYLGGLLVAAGLAMLASRAGAVVIILGESLIMMRLIGREEAALGQVQGEAYHAFARAVPRLWPSLRPRLPSSGLQPRWAPAFLSEAWLWTFAANGFLFAWKLDGHLYWTILWVSGAAYFAMRMVLGRIRRRDLATPAADQPSRESAPS